MVNGIEVIAHRSGPVSYPEQTVAAGLESLSLGADIVEADVRLSRDGKMIISHDDNLARVFGVLKKTKKITQEKFLSQTRKEGAPYHGYTLSDYVSQGVLPLLLHIKEDEAVPEILRFIKENGLEEKITAGASAPGQIRRIKDTDGRIRVLAFMHGADDIDDCISAGADIIRLWEGWYTPALHEKIRRSGKKLWIMTGGTAGYNVGETTEERLQPFIDAGVDGILLNNVTLMTHKKI